MNANKLFSEFSLKKIWEKLLKHDKAMNSTLLVLTSGNWVEQDDGTFLNTVPYSTFKDTDKLTVDLYDDGTISETALTEYEVYIDEFNIIDGALVATANTKPTQTMTIVVKGDFESSEATVSRELLEQCFQSVSNGKALVASAITDKKVPTDADATFETMANNIKDLKLGSGNATKVDVLAGKTFTNSDGVEYTGEMPNQGAKSASLNCGGSYTIPAGYHNGSGKVTANSLASQTSATAAATDIKSGKTAWVNGAKITGTLAATTITKNESKSSSYGIGGYGSTTVTLTYSNTVLGVVSYSITDGNNYAKLTSISISGNKITLGMQTYHGHGASGTLTVTAKIVS